MELTSTPQITKRLLSASSSEQSKRQRTSDDDPAPHLPFNTEAPIRAFFCGVSDSVRWIFEVSSGAKPLSTPNELIRSVEEGQRSSSPRRNMSYAPPGK